MGFTRVRVNNSRTKHSLKGSTNVLTCANMCWMGKRLTSLHGQPTRSIPFNYLKGNQEKNVNLGALREIVFGTTCTSSKHNRLIEKLSMCPLNLGNG